MSGARQPPEPIAQGDLSRTPFAHVLLYIHKHLLEGTLVVWEVPEGEVRPRQDRIVFDHGVPVAGRLLEPASRLDRGLLPLFARTAGPYAFYEHEDLVGTGEGVLQGEVPVLSLIAASLRGSSRDDAVAQVCKGFGGARLRLERGAKLDAFGLLPDETKLIELLRAEPMSVARLAELSPLPPRMAERLVYLLAITKSIAPWEGEAERPSVRAPSPTPPPTSHPPAVPRDEAQGSGSRAKVERARPSARRRGGAPEVPPDPPPGLSPEHRALWSEIAQKTVQIENQTYFDMLGVPRDAPASAVQSAYFNLVKKWHPDRVPKELAPLRPHVEVIFRHLTRAQETLSDEAQRGPYLSSVQDGGGTPSAERQLASIVQAAMEFRKVEVHLKRRELDEALSLVEECLAINDEEPDYHAARGWILFQKAPAGAKDHAEALAAIERALATTPNHDRALYYKGMVLDRMGKSGEATACFRRAAELNPKNIEAVRMVRIADMRGSGPSEKPAAKAGAGSKDSIFGKLFGRKK